MTRPAPVLRGPMRWKEIAKPDGGSRRLVTLDPADDRAFARAVAGTASAVRAAQRDASHADRLLGWDTKRGIVFEPWERARRRWRAAALGHAAVARSAIVTDVRECYASIAPEVVLERLQMLGAAATSVAEIGSWLKALREQGVDGLPVGPAASAVLAEAVLTAGDVAIERAGATHVRWVDDVAIFAPDRRTRSSALEALRRTWGELGLELHDGKTHVLGDPLDAGRHPWGSNSPGGSSALR